MDLPRLRLWQEAALRPGDCEANPWTARHRATPAGDVRSRELRQSLERSRRTSRRVRAAAVHGLFLSALLALPTGFVFTYSTVLASHPEAAECVQVSGMLDGALQRGLSQYRSMKGLTPSQEALLDAKVCDPLLKSVVPSLVQGITSDLDVRAMGEAAQNGSRRPGDWSMLRAVVGAGAQ